MAVGNIAYTPGKVLRPEDIMNTLESTAGDLPLAAAQGNELKNRIREIEDKTNIYLFERGWYRFGIFGNSPHYEGGTANSVEITFKRVYNNRDNEVHKCVLKSLYRHSAFNELYSLSNGKIITKIRHIIDISKKCAYLDFYYDYNLENDVKIYLSNTGDARLSGWTAITPYMVPETAKTETIMSILEFSNNASPMLEKS